MHGLPGLKPTYSLIGCDSTVGMILFRMSCSYSLFCSRGLVVRVVDLRPRGRGFEAY